METQAPRPSHPAPTPGSSRICGLPWASHGLPTGAVILCATHIGPSGPEGPGYLGQEFPRFKAQGQPVSSPTESWSPACAASAGPSLSPPLSSHPPALLLVTDPCGSPQLSKPGCRSTSIRSLSLHPSAICSMCVAGVCLHPWVGLLSPCLPPPLRVAMSPLGVSISAPCIVCGVVPEAGVCSRCGVPP